MNKATVNLEQYQLLIDGKIRPASDQGYFEVINPSTEQLLARVAEANESDVNAAVAAARLSFDQGEWTSLPLQEKGQYLRKIAQLIRENAKVLADLECFSTGKTIKQTTFIDVPTAADCFDYFANISHEFKGEQIPVNDSVLNLTMREAIGVVAAIIPYNYPLIMATWKIAPALMMGNTLILKPSPLGCLSIVKLAELINQAGLPRGVLNVITSKSPNIGAYLVQHPNVDMVSFSGGTETGKEVMRLAAGTTKKLCLELGGKSPNIVFADCDLDAAVGGAMTAIFMNQGQMCTAASRLFLDDKIYDAFLNRFIERTKNLKIGNSASYETDLGPLISRENRTKILAMLETAQKEGARIVCGGRIPVNDELNKGFYFEPTILVDVKNTMTIAQEEVFGPVLSVIRFSEEKEVIQMANASKYGLAASLWSKDFNKANRVAKALRCGTVWINTYGGFYNEVPFGGYKQSGFGRELGKEGLLEYTQTKNICIDTTPSGRSLVTSWF